MSNQLSQSRFTAQNKTTQERLSTNTVGLVALSDFRKRKAEVLEQQEREARELASGATNTPALNTPDRSQTATPNNASDNSGAEGQATKKKKKRTKVVGGNKLSFGIEDDDAEEEITSPHKRLPLKPKVKTKDLDEEEAADTSSSSEKDRVAKGAVKVAPNTAVGILPRAVTNAALRREAAEREVLRKEFLALQAAVKATDIAIPFVFYDGTNIPGGTVRVKKGDFVWAFLDKSRKVGAKLGVGGDKMANARRQWARVGVDDLMLVRGNVIIPHHYEFYFFIMNKTLGPGNRRLFDYSAERPPSAEAIGDGNSTSPDPPSALQKGGIREPSPDISTLEGASDDPAFTKVVDRRWYERNKHIYPASVWQAFDPEKDYQGEVRRDLGGNTFFFSR